MFDLSTALELVKQNIVCISGRYKLHVVGNKYHLNNKLLDNELLNYLDNMNRDWEVVK